MAVGDSMDDTIKAYIAWLVNNKPEVLLEYTEDLSEGCILSLEDWLDIKYPELYVYYRAIHEQ